nr:putative protein [Melanopsichium pennsylvanicum 4]
MTTTHSPLQFDEVSTPTSTHTTASAHRYSLPSTYASSIASSWSRPKRSVWFQQKAIIITSIFLAIFIVLFIGAAVFLRERKFDDELANLDDGEALARIEERMTMGRFSDPIEKQDERDAPRQSFKKKLKLGRNKARDKDQSLLDPSSGSSSAIRRKRHLVSRWTLINLRDTNDTIRATSDTASIRSGHSARQAALGDPRAQENVQITYHSHAPEIPGTDADAHNALHLGSNDIANTSNSLSDQPTTSDRRPRSPPPPHPDGDSSEVRSSSSDPDNTNAESDARSPRRIALDDSDFQAADAHDDMLRHMPPAYIPSGSGAGSSYDPAEALAAALVRGDAKHGIPPPEQRDPGVSPQVINAVLTDAVSASQSEECESVGPTTAHVATDDKAVLGALRDGASMPSAPCTAEASAPAYGVSIQEGVGGSSDSESGSVATPSPSAPALELDTDGFEVPPTLPCASTSDAPIDEKRQFGKGKGKQASTLSTLLPEPPRPVETAFSPFDEPYRDTSPPRTSVPPLSPGRISASIDASAETVSALPAGASDDVVSARKSDKQKEAEQEQQLAALVASRPEDVPRYERHGPSAPVLDDEAVRGPATPSKRLEHLPAYESRRRRSSVAVLAQARLASTCSPATPDTPSGQDGSTAAPCAPSTPSAPPPEGDEK